MNEKITTYNLMGRLKIAVQRGTEEIDISSLLKETTDIYIEGDSFEARIEILPRINPKFSAICRIGLVLKELLDNEE